MVDINPTSLIGNTALNNSLGGKTPAQQTGSGDFFNMIKSGIEDVRDTQSQSEKLTQQALMGEADLADVVQGVAKAEVMLQTMTAIRDRLLSAYQELMNTRI